MSTQFVNVCYTVDDKGNAGKPLKVFKRAEDARKWCLDQYNERSSLEVAKGLKYYYYTMVIE